MSRTYVRARRLMQVAATVNLKASLYASIYLQETRSLYRTI